MAVRYTGGWGGKLTTKPPKRKRVSVSPGLGSLLGLKPSATSRSPRAVGDPTSIPRQRGGTKPYHPPSLGGFPTTGILKQAGVSHVSIGVTPESVIVRAAQGIHPEPHLKSLIGVHNYRTALLAHHRFVQGHENLKQPEDLTNAILLAAGVPEIKALGTAVRLGARAAIGTGEKAAAKSAGQDVARVLGGKTSRLPRLAPAGVQAARVEASAVARRVAQRITPRAVARQVSPKGATRAVAARQARLHSSLPVLGVAGSPVHGKAALVTAPYQIGRVAVENPGKFASATATSLRDSLYGIPSALYKSATDPKGAVDMVLKDLSYRYGPLVQGNAAEFRKRALKGGLTPYAFDALTVGAPAGGLAGRAARASGVKFATEARPALRVSGDVAKEQPLSKNLATITYQRLLDRHRAKIHGREMAKGAPRGTAPALQAGPGEVVRSIKKGPIVSQAKDQRMLAARAKGVGREQMVQEQARELGRGGMAREMGQLNRQERQGIKYAVQLGIRDAASARHELTQRVQAIEAHRRGGPEVAPLDVPKTLDEIPHIQGLIANAEKVFTPKLAHFADLQRERAIRLAHGDPGVDVGQAARRALAQQADHLGVKPIQGESVGQFATRVKQAASGRNLAEPGYFPSSVKQTLRYGDFAVGGTRAVAGPKRYTGRLFHAGIEDPSAQALTQGLARNIKRKYNWNLVADTFDRHTFPWARNKSAHEIQMEAARRGIDPNTLRVWSPGLYKAERSVAEGAAHDARGVSDPMGPSADRGLEQIGGALDRSTSTLGDVLSHPNDFVRSQGWSAVPSDLYNEVHSSVKGEAGGKTGRIWDISKQKSSRLLLAVNPAWNTFQIASNIGVTLAAKTGPVDFVRAQLWWRNLPQAEKEAAAAELGVGHFQTDLRQTKLGGAANNRFVNAYRAFKAHPFWQSKTVRGRGPAVSDMNPFDWGFRFDNAQNNAFRRAVLYSQVKRQAYRDMGSRLGEMDALQSRMASFIGKNPEPRMLEILRNKPLLEKHAEHVRDFLGDYDTFTARERTILNRIPMFYPFLRFSIRFALYTMPVKHPIVTGLLGNLSRLRADEVKKLIGGDDLPYMLGRIYTDGGKTKLDFSRANPLLNAFTQSSGIGQLTGLLPPIAQEAIMQTARVDPFSLKPVLVAGETQPRRYLSISAEDRLRMLGGEAGRLLTPYREWENIATQGRPHGADVLPWDPRPTQYRDPTTVASINAEAAKRGKQSIVGQILHNYVAPWLPQSTRQDKQILSYIKSKKKEERATLHPKGTSGSSTYGADPGQLFSGSASSPADPSQLFSR